MSMQASPLPDVDSDSLAHSARVAAHLREQMQAAGGSIAFSQFMHEALYAPGLGYYAAGLTKFGADGDFVTAPEISSVFGAVIARQVAPLAAGNAILEFGAGTGKLAIDVLTALADLDALPTEYWILEVSPDLAERQQQRITEALGEHATCVHWTSELPTHFEGVMLANEVLDALPVERFVKRGDEIRALSVAAHGDGFTWVESEASAALQSTVAGMEHDLGTPLAEGYTSEVCLAARHWITDLAAALSSGVILLFDYGVSAREYYAEDRSTGWLRCHYRHHVHSDPLILPGIQDLSAWVDFTGVAEAAVAAELEVLTYTSQAQFLIHGGLDTVVSGFTELPLSAQLELASAIKVLTLPGEMGENIKCLALGKGQAAGALALSGLNRSMTL